MAFARAAPITPIKVKMLIRYDKPILYLFGKEDQALNDQLLTVVQKVSAYFMMPAALALDGTKGKSKFFSSTPSGLLLSRILRSQSRTKL